MHRDGSKIVFDSDDEISLVGRDAIPVDQVDQVVAGLNDQASDLTYQAATMQTAPLNALRSFGQEAYDQVELRRKLATELGKYGAGANTVLTTQQMQFWRVDIGDTDQ